MYSLSLFVFNIWKLSCKLKCRSLSAFFSRWSYSTGFFGHGFLYGHHAVKEISTRMLKSPWWECRRDLSLYNLHWILSCIYFVGDTGVLPVLMEELVHEPTVSTSPDAVTAELQSLSKALGQSSPGMTHKSRNALLPLHGVTEDLQTPQAVLKCRYWSSRTTLSTQTDPVTSEKIVMGRAAMGAFLSICTECIDVCATPGQEGKSILPQGRRRTLMNKY